MSQIHVDPKPLLDAIKLVRKAQETTNVDPRMMARLRKNLSDAAKKIIEEGLLKHEQNRDPEGA